MEGIQSYKRANTILGWLVFGFALIVYTLTMEKSGSFWDCGEFISGAYKLQVVHPPGAPIFNIFGRIFTLFAFGDPAKVGLMINFLSSLSTAFVVLFCFWSTTALARKFMLRSEEDYTSSNILAILGAGLVAGLSCTFLDSLWFSAAEGEVYALSMFFMTFVVWAILKWDADDSPFADKWILLIAFMIGLSTGVHLLSMLVIPFAGIIYYLKRYQFSWIGLAAAFGISFLVIGFIMKGIISGIPAFYAKMDLFFVNGMGAPFNTGVIVATILLVGAMAGGIIYTSMKEKVLIQKVLLAITFLVIGYSSFMIVPIRSAANPPINMNRPTDPFSMLSYLNREQYGERPLLFGPSYNADQYDLVREGSEAKKEGLKNKYMKGEDKYDVVGEKFDYVFNDDNIMFFPRLGVWNDPAKVDAYRTWIRPDYHVYDREKKKNLNLYPNDRLADAVAYTKQLNANNESGYGKARYVVKDKLSFADNIGYFFKYQIGYMYMRYFMWNFSGRQNDIQGKYDNDEGGWITGIDFIDSNLNIWGNPRFSQANLSPQRANNMARNRFFAIPFLLGLVGIYFLFKSNWKLGVAVTVMFLTTGIFFIIYGNQPPIEPRERDYTLVGSFFTYCIWIGFAILGMYKLISKTGNKTAAAGIAIAIGMIAPILMGTQGWDDHNRSGRTTTIDFATNYLESCAPNAIIFTQGDNDTYPLWYAQEVEGVRTDVRIVNLSLIGVDWYIDQLRYKMNDADPIKLTFTPDQVRANNRDYTRYMANPKLDANTYYDARQIMAFVAKDDKSVEAQIGEPYYLPTRKLKFPVSPQAVADMDMITLDSTTRVVDALELDVKRSNLLKNDLITIDIIANNINERPIYFAVSVSPKAFLGFQKYFQQEGLTYRVVPVENVSADAQKAPARMDVMYENIMNKWQFGQIAENENIYLDENISRMTLNLISNFAKLAKELVARGEYDKAKDVLDKCLDELPIERVHYNYFHSDFPKLYNRIGETEKAEAMAMDILEAAKAELDYYVYIFDEEVKKYKGKDPVYMNELARGAFTQTRAVSEQLYLLQSVGNSFKNTNPEIQQMFEETLNTYSAELRNVN